MIQQLIDDKDEIVREAVARNLALLVSYVDDHEKVTQFLDILVRLVQDEHPTVLTACQNVLLPVFMIWASAGDSFLDKVILHSTQELAKKIKSKDTGTILAREGSLEEDAVRVESVLKMLHFSLKHIISYIFRKGQSSFFSAECHRQHPICQQSILSTVCERSRWLACEREGRRELRGFDAPQPQIPNRGEAEAK